MVGSPIIRGDSRDFELIWQWVIQHSLSERQVRTLQEIFDQCLLTLHLASYGPTFVFQLVVHDPPVFLVRQRFPLLVLSSSFPSPASVALLISLPDKVRFSIQLVIFFMAVAIHCLSPSTRATMVFFLVIPKVLFFSIAFRGTIRLVVECFIGVCIVLLL
jgi:hypothetical protein